MTTQMGELPIWLVTNAWREIFARIFTNIETEFNTSPAWLINPTTNRRLKIDMLYPGLKVAVRFEGLQGKNRKRRLSLEEEIQQRTRDDARVQICRKHGIELIVIDLTSDNIKALFQDIDLALSRSSEQVAASSLTVIREVRRKASAIAYKIKTDNDLKLYADLWQDRQYQIPTATPTLQSAKPTIAFAAGMTVEHTAFGPGLILEVTPNDGDSLLTIDFITAGQKTLLSSLASDKLIPQD